MAPLDRVEHIQLERMNLHVRLDEGGNWQCAVEKLKDIIQDLDQIMVQVSTYDSMGRPSRDVLANEMYLLPSYLTIPQLTLPRKTLSDSLRTLHAAASPPNTLPSVPPELLEYVENGRNPDIYTREFVELVRRGNQLMRGKMNAFGNFRDVLAEQMNAAMPELREDVARVVEATGGRAGEVNGGQGEGGASAMGTSWEVNMEYDEGRPFDESQGCEDGRIRYPAHTRITNRQIARDYCKHHMNNDHKTPKGISLLFWQLRCIHHHTQQGTVLIVLVQI
jgi:mediator of RNA polymerase II transcription subunit 10